MINRVFGSLLLGLILVSGANAASLSFIGPTDANPGDTFEVQVWGNFDDVGGLAGGGISIDVGGDAVASIVPGSITLANTGGLYAVVGGVAFSSCGTLFNGTPGNANCGDNAMGWGSNAAFGAPPILAPGQGDTLLGTLLIEVAPTAAEAQIILSMSDNSGFTGGWFGEFGAPIDAPSFDTLTINVADVVVPLPAAAWLMIGGLGTLLGFRRRA